MATFVLDTGFTRCLMTDRLAASLQLSGEPALQEDGTPVCFADGHPLQQVTPTLQVGDFYTERCSFTLLKAYRLDMLDCPLDGVLGWQFLCEHAVMFDFQAHRITLWRGGNLTGDELEAAGMQDAVLLPRANRTPGSFDIRVRLNDSCDVSLAVDTGGAHTLLSISDARQLQLEPTRTDFKQPSIFGLLGANEAPLHSLSFRIPQTSDSSKPRSQQSYLTQQSDQKYSQKDRIEQNEQKLEKGMRLTDLTIHYLLQDHPNLPPHLGLDVLSHYRVLIDYPAKTLYLKPASRP